MNIQSNLSALVLVLCRNSSDGLSTFHVLVSPIMVDRSNDDCQVESSGHASLTLLKQSLLSTVLNPLATTCLDHILDEYTLRRPLLIGWKAICSMVYHH